MPAAAPLKGLLRDVVALTVHKKEIRTSEFEKILGLGRTTITRGIKTAMDEGYITRQGATKSLRYLPTDRAKAARALTSDGEGATETLQMTHYGARLAEDYRVGVVVAASEARSGRRAIDNTVTVRRATPKELARCSTSAPSAAARSGPATPETPSTALPSTSGRGDASAPAPVSPSAPPAESHVIPDAARADLLEHDHEMGRHDDHHEADCPLCRSELDALDDSADELQRGPDPLAETTHRAEAPAEETQTRVGPVGAAPAIAPVLGVMGVVTSAGSFLSAPRVALLERDDLEAWRAEKPDSTGAATLDDAALAREQLRARYALRLIDLLAVDAPEHIFDRIESLTA